MSPLNKYKQPVEIQTDIGEYGLFIEQEDGCGDIDDTITDLDHDADAVITMED